MKFNCSHTFTIEAESREDFDEKLQRYSQLVRKASERLDIGYSHGLLFGQPAAGQYEPEKQRAIAEDNVERLFDD